MSPPTARAARSAPREPPHVARSTSAAARAWKCQVGPTTGPTRTTVADRLGKAILPSVSGFRLDKYLVTVGRFRKFVAASVAGWTPAPGSGKHVHLNSGNGLSNSGASGYENGWAASDTPELAATAADWSARLNCEPSFQTWTDVSGSNEALPMNCIDWYEAYAFCIWDGGFLPSEAEWEYAAAGGDEQREYPWGSADPTSGLYLISDCNYPPASTACYGSVNIAPVGTAAAGAARWGQLESGGESRGVDPGLVRALRRSLRRLRLPHGLLVPSRSRRFLWHGYGQHLPPSQGRRRSGQPQLFLWRAVRPKPMS